MKLKLIAGILVLALVTMGIGVVSAQWNGGDSPQAAEGKHV